MAKFPKCIIIKNIKFYNIKHYKGRYSMNRRSQFPDYFIEGCPPNDAKSEEVLVYRMTKNNPATEKDFLPHIILHPNKKDLKTNILAYGISVFRDFDEMDKYRKSIPGMRKMKYNAYGKTTKESGVVKSTPNKKNKSHMTWWLHKDTYPHTFFEMYDGGGE